MVRLPEAGEHIRLAPLRALRAVFTGVGQLVLATDRLRADDEAEQGQQATDDRQESLASWNRRLSSAVRLIPPGATAEFDTGATGASTRRKASTPRKASSSSKTTGTKATKTRSGATGGGRRSGRSKSLVEPSRFRSLDLTGNVRMLSDNDIADLAADARERIVSARLGDPEPMNPLVGYDQLSLPSLRARLRHLDIAELAVLLAYERAHANRADVVTMFERRIAKLSMGA